MPIGAVVEDGKDSIVFVQADPKKPVYTMRRVQVTNRFDRTAYVRSVPRVRKGEGQARRGRAIVPADEPLREGERVLTTGALELKTALASKLSEGPGVAGTGRTATLPASESLGPATLDPAVPDP